ncbi:helix-turn-helix domain-containing protein [Reticulibacter mediterranei]|nr:helix-turn-helix domain-containing protein [Reticulibacter mediterranei]
MKIRSNFSTVIRHAREAKGLQQEALAALLGVSADTVRNWENERSTPTPSIRPKIEEILEISLSSSPQQVVQMGGMRPFASKILFPLNKNRERMLNRVRLRWIEGVLKQVLPNETLITLGLQEQPQAVSNPWQLEVQESNLPAYHLPAATSITQVYDAADGALLVLGEPGAGKTTLLLELTKILLERASDDALHPMPVVFNLSSWAVKRPALADWLMEELVLKYQVPRPLATSWVQEEQILPLLDGLDEVAEAHRAACVQAINAYRQAHGMLPLVVCSRTDEYLSLRIRLQLQSAVVVQPLTSRQVDVYLTAVLSRTSELRKILQHDSVLQEMVSNPLMLTTIAFTYGDQPLSEKLTVGTLAQRRQLILAQYVNRLFQRRSSQKRVTLSRTKHYLAWLARQLLKHNQTEFFLERMQPDWLPDGPARSGYDRLILRLIYSVEIIVTSALFAWVRGGRVNNTIPFGVGAGLFGQLGAGPGNTVFDWMAPGLGGGVEAGGSLGVIFTLVFTVSALLIGGSVFPLSWTSIVRSVKQGVKHMLIATSIIGLLAICVFTIFGGWMHGLLYGSGAGIFAGVVIGLLSAFAGLRETSDVQQHSLRTRLVDGAIIGICGGLGFALVDFLLGITLQSVMIYAFIIGIFTFCAFSFAGASKLIPHLGTIQPAEAISWSWTTTWSDLLRIVLQGGIMVGFVMFVIGVVFGGASGAFYGVAYGSRYGLIFGLITGVIVGVVGILSSFLQQWWSSTLLATTQLLRPNEGIHRSLEHAVIVGLLFCPASGIVIGTACGIAFGALGNLASWPILAAGFAVVFGLYVGFQFAMSNGGIAWIEHYLLRVFLWRLGTIPFNYVDFLDDAVSHVVLRKIGGGYMFAHRLLLDYFASLSDAESTSDNDS